MAKTENRFIRIEDWKGNVYYPESSNSSSSLSGFIIDSDSASKDATGTSAKTDGDKISDSRAYGGSSIMLSSTSERGILFTAYVSKVPFGEISITARMKSSIGTGTTNLVEINTYFVDASGEELVETLLDTRNVNGYMFGVANEYVNIGMTTNYEGVATGETFLKIEIIVLPDTGATIYFDYLILAMAMQSSSSSGGGYINVRVEDRTVIIEDNSGGSSGGGSSGGGSSASRVYVEDRTIIVVV